MAGKKKSGKKKANKKANKKAEVKQGVNDPGTSGVKTEQDKEKDPDHRTTMERQLHEYITRDHLHAAALIDQNAANAELVQEKRKELEHYQGLRRERQVNPGAVFGPGYWAHAEHAGENKTRVVYPEQRRRPGRRRTKELRASRADRAAQAEQLEELVPIRLDIEHENIKLRDTFTWNLHERLLTPQNFAQQMVEDFGVPADKAAPVVEKVVQSMREQIENFYPHPHMKEEEPLDPHQPYHAYKNDDMRILIKLNITIGQHTLVDQFEWDINEPLNSPEAFATQTARDLSLSGEFTTAIAHSIREQVQLFTKSLYVTGHPFDGRPVEDPELRDAFLPSPLPSVFRTTQQAKEYGPYLWELNETELERAESSLSRDQRRHKRSVNRRGGPALPDLKDRPRTVRTLTLSSTIPGAAETVEDSRLYKKAEASGPGRPSRRGAMGGRDGADDSDGSDSELSRVDSPAPTVPNPIVYNSSTRRRGVRNAASAAQAAMRANYGRSATPELSMLSETTRTSSRRAGTRELRDESVLRERTSLMVKLRINSTKLRHLERRGQSQASNGASGPTRHPSNNTLAIPPPTFGSTSVVNGTPHAAPPPTTMAAPAAATTSDEPIQQHIGAIDAPWPPPPEHLKPDPPSWLTTGLTTLQRQYPYDSFTGIMRFAILDPITNKVRQDHFPTNKPLPKGFKAQFIPRIRCNDCPGKLYTPGPNTTVQGFAVHLAYRNHRERVDRRIKEGVDTEMKTGMGNEMTAGTETKMMGTGTGKE
ncbi:MAG: glycosyl transferase [Watsoniomyces obsoletus]|nr:MAG: glycosyl transferase [Watsoniomyces obsoletus]